MIRILITIIIYSLSFIGIAQNKTNGNSDDASTHLYQVQIEINNIRSSKGAVYFALYDSEANFRSRKTLQSSKGEIVNGQVIIKFNGLEPGIYAISCFHDANDNGKLDFDNKGIPSEDYGFTNNRISFGPPQFNDAQFVIKDKDLTFEIIF